MQRCLADGGQGRAVQDDSGEVEKGGGGDKEEEGGSGSDGAGVGVVGAARCARHHPATVPRELLVDKVASMPEDTGAGAHCRCRGALRTAGRDVRSEMTPATLGRMAVG